MCIHCDWRFKISRLLPAAKSKTSKRLTDEEKLLQYLFADYRTEARPVLNSKDTVNVTIQFSLMHIKELVSELAPLLYLASLGVPNNDPHGNFI
jgi:hypothetical protein